MKSKKVAVLYRVEHTETGKGPWRGGHIYHDVDLSDIGNQIPLPHDETWNTVQGIALPTRGERGFFLTYSCKMSADLRCAFPSVLELRKHFPISILRQLKKCGFEVVEIHTNKFAIGENQALYNVKAVKSKKVVTQEIFKTTMASLLANQVNCPV